jgi:hypothetical protein
LNGEARVNDWIILRLRDGGSIEYEDDDGDVLEIRHSSGIELSSRIGFTPALGRTFETSPSRELGERIRRNLSELHASAGWNEPAPLPIFVAKPETMSWERTESLVYGMLRDLGIPLEEIQLTRLAGEVTAERKAVLNVTDAVTLPLVIGWFGDEARDALEVLKNREWVREVGEDGLRIMDASGWCPDPDILVFSGLPAFWKPARVTIVLDRDGVVDNVLDVPPGRSLLVIRSGQPGAFLKAFVYGVIHDQPLHAALHTALREVNGAAATLYSNPAANQALRLSDTFVSLFERAKRLDDVLAFDHEAVRRFEPDARMILTDVRTDAELLSFDTLRGAPDAASRGFQTLQKNVRELTHDVAADFNHESGGFVPMARNAIRLQTSEAAVTEIERWLNAVGEGGKNAAVLHPNEQRLFDVSLMRRELRGSDTLFVDKRTAVMARRRYVVRAQIGRPLAQSLVVQHGPDVDSQLPPPPPGGHLLTVVLYPFDFQCKSPVMQTLRLPERGPSEPIYFEVLAPARHGPAEMRIALYYELPPGAPEGAAHRNHLLQSFLLQTQVGQYEETADRAVTLVHLEVARRPAFGDLASLGHRIVSLGMNASSLKPDEHRFTVKGSEVTSWVSFPEQTVQTTIDDIRGMLSKSTRLSDGADPRFPKEFGESQREARKKDFDSVIRTMARRGSDLYSRVWRDRPGASADENTKHQQALMDIRENADNCDKIIQIMRYDRSYAFPWALLYDFALPSKPAEAPVCDGFLRTVDGKPITCGDCLKNCKHATKGEDAICVWGFWGLRFVVEQLLHDVAASVANVIEPLRDGGVLVSVGFASPYFDAAVKALEKTLGTTIRKLGDLDEPEDIFWSEDGRPAIAVFLGHHDPADEGDWELSLPGGRSLGNRALRNRLQKRAGNYWNDPHTVVILAACGSAPADLKKLSTFVDTFAQAKASAVIGTEVVVFDGLAADLAKSLVTSMLQSPRTTLGRAVLDFRRALLRELSPLGFVVTPYGDADIQLAVKGDA